ncbi:class IIc cyclic bacteriocin [Salinithrix halophila]|uniref:Class IIc cyclic bacteriocin n=1 Tax=Salinithrix halophila TaxID=1485204 RepID=A0ABV8JEH1_9BACL
MQTNFLRQHLNLLSWETAVLVIGVGASVLLSATMNINFICDQLGVTITGPEWRKITDYVAAGGSLATGFAVIAGITVPAWLASAAAAFGIYAA